MAHKIWNNQIAWKGETPWHGLGVKVPQGTTGEEMLQRAKLNWTVSRRALAMKSREDQDVVLTAPLAEYRAIVRDTDDHVFQVATDKYHPVQNREIVEFFREFAEAGHAELETVGGIEGGRIVWALARLNHNGASDTVVGGADENLGYVLLANSHDGSLRLVARATSVRVVCWNTLSAALFDGDGKLAKRPKTFVLSHRSKFDAAAKARAASVVELARHQVAGLHETAQVLSRIQVDDKGREEFVRLVLGIEPGASLLDAAVEQTAGEGGLLDRIAVAQEAAADNDGGLKRLGKAILGAIATGPGANLPGTANTLWGAVNGVTYHADHLAGRGQDTRLASTWFGAGDARKAQAVKVALEMAGQGYRA